MPYCVNCGIEVSRDCIKCPGCSGDPWKLAGDNPSTPGDKSNKLYLAPVLSLFVLFCAIFLLFGFSIWQLGVFSGAGSSSRAYYERDMVGGPREIMLGKTYHVYRAFDFGDFAVFVNIIGLSMLTWSWYKLQKAVKSMKTLTLAVSGVVFIIFAFFIFIFGFNDLLTFTEGNVYYKPTFTQQYGWVIESIIFGFLGYILLMLGGRFRKKEGVELSLYSIIMIPVAYVLILVVLLVYIFGLHNALHTSDYTNYRTNLAWIVETFVFGLSCILLFMRARRMLKVDGARLDFITPLILASSILLIATLIVYLLGVHSTFWDLGRDMKLTWIGEALGFGIPCAVFLMKAESVRRIEYGRGSLYTFMLATVGVILMILTVFVYIAGVHMSLYNNYYSNVNFSWIIEIILFGLPSLTFLIAGDNIRKRESQGKPILPCILLPVSGLLLSITLIVFILGVHSMLWDGRDCDFRWIVEAIVFLVPSMLFLIYGDRTGNIRSIFLISTSALLLLSALFIYVFGIHWVLSDYKSRSNDLVKILAETLIFAVPSVVSLIHADRIRRTKPGLKSVLPYTLIPVSLMLVLAFLFAYITGIHATLSDKYGEIGFMWVVEALMFLTPGVYLLWKSDRIRKTEGAMRSVFTYPSYGIGGILLAATLIVFIFGLDSFLYNTEQNLNWFVEAVVYLISAVIPLYLSGKVSS